MSEYEVVLGIRIVKDVQARAADTAIQDVIKTIRTLLGGAGFVVKFESRLATEKED